MQWGNRQSQFIFRPSNHKGMMPANRPISPIPQCIRKISHNAPFCNRNVHICAHFCYKMLHCGIWHRCILGFVRLVYWRPCLIPTNSPVNWPNSQIPECTWSISHNTPFRTEMCIFLFWMEHYGIWIRCILGFVKLVYCHQARTVAVCPVWCGSSWQLERFPVVWQVIKRHRVSH